VGGATAAALCGTSESARGSPVGTLIGAGIGAGGRGGLKSESTPGACDQPGMGTSTHNPTSPATDSRQRRGVSCPLATMALVYRPNRGNFKPTIGQAVRVCAACFVAGHQGAASQTPIHRSVKFVGRPGAATLTRPGRCVSSQGHMPALGERSSATFHRLFLADRVGRRLTRLGRSQYHRFTTVTIGAVGNPWPV
jgi:hypothetical protein